MSSKKVSFFINYDIKNDINKKPCLCTGCDNCSVKNHHCNLFTEKKCIECKDNICFNCININNKCFECSTFIEKLPDYMNNLLQ